MCFTSWMFNDPLGDCLIEFGNGTQWMEPSLHDRKAWGAKHHPIMYPKSRHNVWCVGLYKGSKLVPRSKLRATLNPLTFRPTLLWHTPKGNTLHVGWWVHIVYFSNDHLIFLCLQKAISTFDTKFTYVYVYFM